MTHGAHWSALSADVESLTDERIPEILRDGTLGYQAHARVTGPDDVVRMEEVSELLHGSGPIRFMAYVATDATRADGHRVFVAAFPVCWEGTTRALCIDEVTVDDGDVEAVVTARLSAERGLLWFFDPHHFVAPARYQPGTRIEFILAGLAYILRPASFDTVEVTHADLLKTHRQRMVEKDPTIDPRTITSVPISFEQAAFMFPRPDRPEEAEFMTTIDQVDHFECLGFRFSRIWGTFTRSEDGEPLRLPVYASPKALGEYRPKVGDRVEGAMWLQGRPVPKWLAADAR
jgi:hypothetical protein